MTQKDTHGGFKVGDWVMVKPSYVIKALVGRVGRVVNIVDSSIGVDFGPGFRGNHLDGVLATPTGYFLQPKCLKFDRRGTLKRYLCLK
jgi:hypothetical protein